MENPQQRRLGYRNLDVWKKSISLASAVGGLLSARRWDANRGLRDQLQRSTVSIPSNISEGEDQITNKASLKFYYIARGSLAEVRSQLILAKSQHLLEAEQFNQLDAQCEIVARLIGGVIRARRAREERR